MNRRPVIIADQATGATGWSMEALRPLIWATYRKALRKHPDVSPDALLLDLTFEPGKAPRWVIHDGAHRPSVLSRPWTMQRNARRFLTGQE